MSRVLLCLALGINSVIQAVSEFGSNEGLFGVDCFVAGVAFAAALTFFLMKDE